MNYDGCRWKDIDRDVFHSIIRLAYDEKGKLDISRLVVHVSFTDTEHGEFYTEWGFKDSDLPIWREHRTQDPITGEISWRHSVLVLEEQHSFVGKVGDGFIGRADGM